MKLVRTSLLAIGFAIFSNIGFAGTITGQLTVKENMSLKKILRYETLRPGHYNATIDVAPVMRLVELKVNGDSFHFKQKLSPFPLDRGPVVLDASGSGQNYDMIFNVVPTVSVGPQQQTTESCLFDQVPEQVCTWLSGVRHCSIVYVNRYGNRAVDSHYVTTDRDYTVTLAKPGSSSDSAEMTGRTHDVNRVIDWTGPCYLY